MDGLEQLVSTQDDVYATLKDASKLDLIHLVNCKSESDDPETRAIYQSFKGNQELPRARQLRVSPITLYITLYSDTSYCAC